ncbi:hypothetical protein Rwratislav_04103 [Rhodococcus wratislaviensis IFP 2016]|nr:hypothetical protein Rwratislav_04103 [Rhodococcus wratislaviensis IFP 2016]
MTRPREAVLDVRGLGKREAGGDRAGGRASSAVGVDDEGAVLADAQVNVVATAIARVYGAIWQPFCGVAVFGRPTTATARLWGCLSR